VSNFLTEVQYKSIVGFEGYIAKQGKVSVRVGE